MAYRPVTVSPLQLARACAAASTLRESRLHILTWLRAQVPHDGALIHALSPRVPLHTAVTHGIDVRQLAASQRGWDDLAVELGALRAAANERHAASLDEVYPRGSSVGRRARQLLRTMLGMRSLCIVHLTVRGRVRGAVLLLSKRADAFDARQVARLRNAAALLSICDALHEELDDAPRTSAPAQFRCTDTRLTARQQRIVEHVALGHRNADIANALGISPHTVRNTLARIFTRIDASNRADLIRLAVLTPNENRR